MAYLGEVLTNPLTKKSAPDSHLHGGIQQHPQGGRQERVLAVLAEAGGGHQIKIKSKSNQNHLFSLNRYDTCILGYI